MNNLKIFLTVIGLVLLIPGNDQSVESSSDRYIQNSPHDKIQVLNFGTFHMGFTNDAKSTEFDEHDRKNREKVHEIAEKLSDFNPTVILVETVPEDNSELRENYFSYLDNPDMVFDNPSEVELLAFELGRLSGTEQIHGIDHKMSYNYKIGQLIDNKIDSTWHDAYYEDPLQFYPAVNADEDTLSLFEKLQRTNHDRYLDFLIAVNADMLTHAGTEDGFEGADEAAKYYQRNLRMFSNLNRLDLSEDDRVFILMGASHTAFFRDFMSRDPKYNMVDTFEYLR